MAAVINTIYLHPPHTVRAEDEMNNEDSKKKSQTYHSIRMPLDLY